jgi:hypothetical protein
LSHIPSPAEPNMLLDGNCDASPPKHAVAVLSHSIKHNNFINQPSHFVNYISYEYIWIRTAVVWMVPTATLSYDYWSDLNPHHPQLLHQLWGQLD